MNSKILKNKINQIKPLLKQAKGFSNKHGYIFLPKSHNKKLFKLLNDIGFFKFHRTNIKKCIVGYHQVSLFLSKGWQILKFGGTCLKHKLEVHHIDHNPKNNDPLNLEYTTPSNNKAIATIIDICTSSHASYFNASVKFDLDAVDLFKGVPFVSLLLKSIHAVSATLNKDLFNQLLFCLPWKQSKLIYNTFLKLYHV